MKPVELALVLMRVACFLLKGTLFGVHFLTPRTPKPARKRFLVVGRATDVVPGRAIAF
jgi:hypothetical protein